jgi:hypothetical protein
MFTATNIMAIAVTARMSAWKKAPLSRMSRGTIPIKKTMIV